MHPRLIPLMNHTRMHSTEALDRLSRWMMVTPPGADDPLHASSRVLRLGVWSALAVFGVGGLWCATAPLDSAAVAPGQVVIHSSKKAIQHLEGGIVDAIYVHEGERVKAGQKLIRLHETASKAKLQAFKSQYFTARATETRLLAERDGKDIIDLAAMPFAAATHSAAETEILKNQEQIFRARMAANRSQVEIVQQKIAQHRQQIRGLNDQVAAQTRQLALLQQEIGPVRRLLAKGYSSKPRLLNLEQRTEELFGARAQNQAAIAQTEQAIAEAELQIVNFRQQTMAETVKELKDTQLQISELDEQIRTSTDVLDRVGVVAPLDGYVTGLNVHTLGGVISPGETLMNIVPTGDRLIVEAQVAPNDIDLVRPGLIAHVRLSAYKTRHMPLVDGTVATVSADKITDPKTGAGYYTARIEVDAKQLAALKNVKLTPGMPTEVLIVTGSRTLLAYLFDPFSETLRKSFRED